MSNTRILYHGTTMENAITMLGSNFSSIVDETVWNCSDDDMLYMVEKDYDGEENEGLRIAAEAAQIAAAYLGSESSDLVVLKLEIPEFMLRAAATQDTYLAFFIFLLFTMQILYSFIRFGGTRWHTRLRS